MCDKKYVHPRVASLWPWHTVTTNEVLNEYTGLFFFYIHSTANCLTIKKSILSLCARKE